MQKGGAPIKYGKDGKIAVASKPKPVQTFNGKDYVLEESIFGDYAIIKAHKADPYGNLSECILIINAKLFYFFFYY